MPLLHIVGGPNGSGKTAFYQQALSETIIPHNPPFINVDLIAQSFGGYNEINYQIARL